MNASSSTWQWSDVCVAGRVLIWLGWEWLCWVVGAHSQQHSVVTLVHALYHHMCPLSAATMAILSELHCTQLKCPVYTLFPPASLLPEQVHTDMDMQSVHTLLSLSCSKEKDNMQDNMQVREQVQKQDRSRERKRDRDQNRDRDRDICKEKEEEWSREGRFPCKLWSCWPIRGDLTGLWFLSTTSMEVGCSAKDNPSKGGSLRGTVGSLSTAGSALCREQELRLHRTYVHLRFQRMVPWVRLVVPWIVWWTHAEWLHDWTQAVLCLLQRATHAFGTPTAYEFVGTHSLDAVRHKQQKDPTCIDTHVHAPSFYVGTLHGNHPLLGPISLPLTNESVRLFALHTHPALWRNEPTVGSGSRSHSSSSFSLGSDQKQSQHKNHDMDMDRKDRGYVSCSYALERSVSVDSAFACRFLQMMLYPAGVFDRLPTYHRNVLVQCVCTAPCALMSLEFVHLFGALVATHTTQEDHLLFQRYQVHLNGCFVQWLLLFQSTEWVGHL